MTTARRRALAAVFLLEHVLERELTPIAALHEWPDIHSERDELLSASWRDLSHYAADVDIRVRDPRYAKYQVELLARRVEEIREKFQIDEACEDDSAAPQHARRASYGDLD